MSKPHTSKGLKGTPYSVTNITQFTVDPPKCPTICHFDWSCQLMVGHHSPGLNIIAVARLANVMGLACMVTSLGL